MEHRRLMMLFAGISLFAFGVIAWYFLFATPKSAPTLEGTSNPLAVIDLPARFGFIFNRSSAPETTSETEVTLPGSQPLVQVWSKPTTGNTFVARPILKDVTATTTVGTSTSVTTKTVRATTTVLMFVDRITGYVYGYVPGSSEAYQISNTTIPGVYDAYIWSGGNKIVIRYLDADRKTILSLLADIPAVQEGRDPQPLSNVTNLPKNISAVAVNPNFTEVSYVVPSDFGATFYSINSRGTTRLADSPFKEWVIFYGGNTVYATTKASAFVQGMTVSLPTFSRIVGDKTGLLTTAAPGGLMLSSMWSASGLTLFTSLNGSLKTIQVRTLAPKCKHTDGAFFICGIPKSLPSYDEGLPDDWYQGRVLFDDKLTLVDASLGEIQDIYSFDQTYGPIDVTNIQTLGSGELISFIKKQDGSLFLLNTLLLGQETDNE